MGPLAFTAGIIGWSAMGVVLVTIGSGRNSVGGTIFGIETSGLNLTLGAHGGQRR